MRANGDEENQWPQLRNLLHCNRGFGVYKGMQVGRVCASRFNAFSMSQRLRHKHSFQDRILRAPFRYVINHKDLA